MLTNQRVELVTIYGLQPKLHVMGVSIGVLKANPELDVKIIFSKNHNIFIHAVTV